MKKSLLLGLVTIALLSSCSKTKDSEKSPTTCHVTEIDETFAGDPNVYKIFYTINNDGKVSREDWNTKVSNDFLTYTYQADKIVITASPSIGTSYNATYTLSNGTISKFIGKVQSTDFTYDANGYLIKAVTTSGSTVQTYTLTYTDGNLTKIVQGTKTVNITYGTELYKNALGYENALLLDDNLLQDAGNSAIVSAGYFGKASKNLAIGKTISGVTNPGSFTYSKDSKGNLDTMNETLTTGGVNKATFVYSCK